MSPNEQATTLVNRIDLSRVIEKLQEKDHFDHPRAEEAVRMYRQFLLLIVLNPTEIIVPNEDVDAAWHHHILDTQKYFQDCENLFGQYLHHNPNYYGTEAFYNSCDRTQELYKQTYGTSETFLVSDN